MMGDTPQAVTRRVIRTVAEAFAVDVNHIITPRRWRPLVAARQMCMALLFDGFDRNDRPRSLPEVGRIFRRDHTTVLHGVRRHRALCEQLGLSRRPDDLASHASILALHLGYISPKEAERFLAVRVPPAPTESERTEIDVPGQEPEAPADPIPTIVHPPEPKSPPMLATLPALIPARLSNGADFGIFDVDAWRGLPTPMRREGLLLFLTRDEIERPKANEQDRIRRAARAFDLRVEAVDEILECRERHDLPREAPDSPDARVIQECASDDVAGFLQFANARLVMDENGTVAVPLAFDVYDAFAQAEGFDRMTRASFGAALKRHCRGARVGSVQYGARLED